LTTVGTACAALIGGSLLGLAVRIWVFVTAIVGLHAFARLAAPLAGVCPWADPVYTQVALSSLGDVHLHGLALAGAARAGRHRGAPAVFADPGRAHFALARVVVEPGSALTGRLVGATLAHAGALCLGVALVAVGAGWRPGQRRRAPSTAWLVL